MMRGASATGLLAALFASLLLVPASAQAHEPPKVAVRELIRLEGVKRGDGPAPAGRMTLRAQGVDHPFAAIDRRVFTLTADGAAPPAIGDRYTLQGPRPLLFRFTNAPPDQPLVILAERRAGAADLFVLALDLLCSTLPAEPGANGTAQSP